MEANNSNTNTGRGKQVYIGSGKLLEAFTDREYDSSRVEKNFIISPRPTSNLSRFKEKGFKTSISYSDATGASAIVVLVTPGGFGNVIAPLRRISIDPTAPVIFIVSGADISTVRAYCSNLLDSQIVIATCNTNVRYGLGRFSYFTSSDDTAEKAEEFFSLFGSSEREEKESLVLPAITSYGSDNAIIAKALEIIYKKHYGDDDKYLADWLKLVEQGFNDEPLTGFIGTESDDESYNTLMKHLKLKVLVQQRHLGYNEAYATARVAGSFKSAIDALVASNVCSFAGLERHIAGVATKGGNTEKGLAKIVTLHQLLDFREFSDIYGTMFEFSKTFRNTALGSIPDAIQTDDGLHEHWLLGSRQ